jgi:probable F420-dependent oxidoreductase
VLGDARRLLDATRRPVVATGILNVWMHEAGDVATGHAELTAAHPGRFLLGLGVSHAPAVERSNQQYRKPFSKMVESLDALDAATPPVPRTEEMLAALGPRMLGLAAQRTLGAHPYFVPPEHTAVARAALGAGPLLATEQMVVLDDSPTSARAIAREHASRYLVLPNYTNNLRKLGFDDDDFAGTGSDRLIDAIVAWGDGDSIVRRVRAHHDAGADHVCVQVLLADPAAFPRDQWRALASALI